MRLFVRAAAFVAAVLVVGYGMLALGQEDQRAWLVVVAAAFVLLIVALWPTFPAGGGVFERSLTRTAVVLFVVFILISVQLLRIQVVQSEAISSRQAATERGTMMDPREMIRATQVARGRILAAGGEPIADTVVEADGTWRREYADPAAAYVAGYFSPLAYGMSGLEQTYNAYLRGEEGGNPFSEWLDGILQRGRRGYDLTLSLNLDLQRRADELLGDQTGAVVVMDAKTGAVLALVSKPHIDPARLYTNVGPDSEAQVAAARAYWEEVTQPGSSALVLRPTQGLYAPGSVFKTVTAAAAIETGVAAPDTVYRDEGALTVDGRVIPEENRPDPNRVSYTLTEAYGWSLNVVYAQIGLQLGAQRLDQYAKRFGFDQEIPFDLPTAASQLARDDAFLSSRAALADTAFGQGQLFVTPLQMALVAAAVVNDGEIMRPYLVERVSTFEGKTLQTRSPEVWKRAISSETAATMRDIMIQSVHEGYAQGAAIPGYVVGGKTGTAEAGDGPPHAWFLGFAGKDDPRYVVAVIVEHGGEGGRTALPIGRELLRQAVEQAGP
ncbi:MAG: penicillin-binding protein 2 [Sphaerobacter sp.]|nr:penicillin-binding protein 2 [Sphaerobacter sp.]